ncbi:MAG: histidinol-phosphatase HisJ family protein [Ruminococcus sp.]|nr:histidinol-phosphatase HisJ family protein [Ruminococcus sp.]
MLPMDCHTHTDCSPDSDAPAAAMLASAQAKGIGVYALTDHIELCRFWQQGFYDVPARNEEDFFDYAARYERAMQQNQMAKALWRGDMQIISGIEMGEPNADFALAESLLQDKRLDFVIASLHELPDKLDFYFLDYAQEDVDALLNAYFSELLRICQWGKFDVLGHLTYPLRYIAQAGITVDMAQWREPVAECLKAVIRNRRGIEINTSGYSQSYGKPYPDRECLELYKDLGGSILSLGSDAHAPSAVGGGIAQGAALAKACGFHKVSYFLRHEPHDIEL